MRHAMTSMPGRQGGAVLIIALLLLVVLTLLGTSSMQNTVLQERMAGNMNQRNLGLQAAEAALREGESWLAGLAAAPVEKSTSPNSSEVWKRDAPIVNSDRYWWTQASESWWNSGSTRQATEYDAVPGQSAPRYVIEHRFFKQDNQVVGFGPPTGRDYHRLTARGVGQTNTAKTTLQSHFTRRYN